MKKNILYGIIIGFMVLVIDQLTKYRISQEHLVTNTGMAWGLFANAQTVLIVISIIIIAVMIKYFSFHPIAFGFVLGGALGNLLDRLMHSHVRDFINIHLFNFPIFNIADIAINIGIILLIIKVLKEK